MAAGAGSGPSSYTTELIKRQLIGKCGLAVNAHPRTSAKWPRRLAIRREYTAVLVALAGERISERVQPQNCVVVLSTSRGCRAHEISA
jgi:hypothetical protein